MESKGKVEKVPKTVVERRFSPHFMKLNKKVEKLPQYSTKGSSDNATDMNRGSRDDVTQLRKNRRSYWRECRKKNTHRDENSKRSSNERGLKLRQNVNEGSPEIFTVNESHRDDRIFKPRKRKYIDWNPYLRCQFLNPNSPSKTHYGTVRMDSGARSSFIHESLLPFCEVMKFEKYNGTEAKGAGGHSIPLADYTVDIAMKIEDLGIFMLRKVLVSKSPLDPFKQTGPNFLFGPSFLLGLSDMNRLKIEMDFRTKRVKFGVGPNRGKWIKMKSFL